MIATIAYNTFRETVRQKLVLLAAVCAVALAAVSKFFLRLDLGHEQLRFIFDFSSGALNFFGAIIAVSATCHLFSAEIENKTVITLLSKSVNMFDFVFGKLAGVCMATAVFCAAVFCAAAVSLLAVQIASGAASGTAAADGANFAGLAVYCGVQWLKLCMCAAVAAAVCGVSGSFLFSLAVSFMCVFVSVMGNSLAGLGGNANAFVEIASYLFPDFRLLDTAEAFAFGAVDFRLSAFLCAYAAVYICAAAGLAAFLFSRRDF